MASANRAGARSYPNASPTRHADGRMVCRCDTGYLPVQAGPLGLRPGEGPDVVKPRLRAETPGPVCG